MLMMVPYPNIVNKRFVYFNYAYNLEIVYQGNIALHILSLVRVVYFGYYLVTLSRYWSSSAQRVA